MREDGAHLPPGKPAGSEQTARSLGVLSEIARLLNSRVDIESALDEVLQLVTRLLGLQTAWLFLVRGPGRRLEFAAAWSLPPALQAREQRPLRRGFCTCFDLFYREDLHRAVNVVECSRLEEARGDRRGLVYHASVPLRSSSATLGILNVAAPGENLFDREALDLLTAVGEHLATALERSRLFAEHRQRALNFVAVDRVSRALGEPTGSRPGDPGAQRPPTPAAVARRFAGACLQALGLDAVCVALAAPDEPLRLVAVATASKRRAGWAPGSEVPRHSLLALAWRFGRAHFARARQQEARQASAETVLASCGSWAAVPVRVGRQRFGAVQFERREAASWPEPDRQALIALADHLALALEHVRLVARERELAQVDERQRLSRDLHDSVSQKLFSLHMLIAAARQKLAARAKLPDGSPADPEGLAEVLCRAEQQARESLQEMRRLVRELRPAAGRVAPEPARRSGPAPLPGLPWASRGGSPGTVFFGRELGEALARALGGDPLAHQLGVEVRLQVTGPAARTVLDAVAFEAALRVAQEAVHNALKHSQAAQVRVCLARRRRGLDLSVSDNGLGFDRARARASGGQGLAIMAERCRLAGGRLVVRSHPGFGTRVRAWLPAADGPVADDHAVVRTGLRLFLGAHPDVEVVGEAGCAGEVVAETRRLKPDVVLMDLVMPSGPQAAGASGAIGIETIAALRREAPGVRCLVLTSFGEEDKVLPALEAGAAGYLLKDVTPDELIRAVRAVASGQSYLSAGVAATVVRRATGSRPPSPRDRLTRRELEVLGLLARGLTNGEIASTLFISKATVKSHVTSILRKLEVEDRTRAALMAARWGLGGGLASPGGGLVPPSGASPPRDPPDGRRRPPTGVGS